MELERIPASSQPDCCVTCEHWQERRRWNRSRPWCKVNACWLPSDLTTARCAVRGVGAGAAGHAGARVVRVARGCAVSWRTLLIGAALGLALWGLCAGLVVITVCLVGR